MIMPEALSWFMHICACTDSDREATHFKLEGMHSHIHTNGLSDIQLNRLKYSEKIKPTKETFPNQVWMMSLYVTVVCTVCN